VRYALPLFLVVHALGILLVDRVPISVEAILWSAAGLVVLYGLLARLSWGRPAVALALTFCAGAFSFAIRATPSSSEGPTFTEDYVVEARVCDGPRLGSVSVFVVLCSVKRLPGPGLERSSPGDTKRSLAGVELRAYAGDPEYEGLTRLRAGDRLRAWLRVRPMESRRNPGGRDAKAEARRRGIAFQARLRSPDLWVRVLEEGNGWEEDEAGWRETFSGFRKRAIAGLTKFESACGETSVEVRPCGGALLAALALGDRQGIPPVIKEAFARLGLSHLLAVSGLHLMLMAGMAYRFVFFVSIHSVGGSAYRDRRPWALGGALTLSLAYAVWAGFGVPVQRAWVLLAMWIPMAWLKRRPPQGWGLVWAAWFVLLVRPGALFELGAQLSFAATAGLLMAMEHESPDSFPDRSRFGVWLARATRVSLVAIAVTAPFLSNAGLPVGVGGLVMNLIAVPFVGLVLLPVALVASGLALIPGSLAATGLAWAQTLAGWTVIGCLEIAGLWPLPSWQGSASVVGLGVAAGLAVLIVRESDLGRAGVLLVCLLVWLLAPISSGFSLDVPRVVMFDVGQGDSVVLQGRRATVLIDAGRSFVHGGGMGRSVVAPGLRALGIARLDAVVASHADLDHRGGLLHVVSQFDVGEIWLPATKHGAQAFEALRALARKRGIPVLELDAEDADRVVGDLVFETLWPPAEAGGESTNEDSLVLRAEIAGRRILLTGDIGESTERALLDRGANVRADLLKVAHHGSAHSSTTPFLEAVDATFFLISASCSGFSGLPSDRVLQKLEGTAGVTGWTGRDGALVVDFASDSPEKGGMTLRGWAEPRDCPVGEARS
jgi:DNA internalization-related competence protein ComEC/Rec2